MGRLLIDDDSLVSSLESLWAKQTSFQYKILDNFWTIYEKLI